MGATARDKIVAAHQAAAAVIERARFERRERRLAELNRHLDEARSRMFAGLSLDATTDLTRNTDAVFVNRAVAPQVIEKLGDEFPTEAIRHLIGWAGTRPTIIGDAGVVHDRIRLTGLHTEFTIRYRADYETAPEELDELTWYATLHDGARQITTLTDIDPGTEPEEMMRPHVKFHRILTDVFEDLLTHHHLDTVLGTRATYPHWTVALSDAYCSPDEELLVRLLAGDGRTNGPAPYVAKTTLMLTAPPHTAFRAEFWVDRNPTARTLDELTFHAHLYRDGEIIGAI